MTRSIVTRITALVLVVVFAAGCANTIRGVGRDTAAAVDATQRAGEDIQQSTY